MEGRNVSDCLRIHPQFWMRIEGPSAAGCSTCRIHRL